MTVYSGDLHSLGDLLSNFDLAVNDVEGCHILLAHYSYEDYSGSAFVLFIKDGVLYEVHGSHCSCYGLEGQWEPEETTYEALIHRLTKGGDWFGGFRHGVEAFLYGLRNDN